MSIFSLHSRRFFKGARSSGRKGFTIIELLVVVAIMVIITTVLVVRQQQFNSSTLGRSLAYSVALSIRQAQTYGTSVRASNSNFTAKAYGLYFDTSQDPSTYVLFADTNGNGRFDSPPSGDTNSNGVCDGSEDCVTKSFTLNGGYRVSRFCALFNSPEKFRCSDIPGVPDISQATAFGRSIDVVGFNPGLLNIMFRRPNPDACFYIEKDGQGAGVDGDDCSNGVPSNAKWTGGYIEVAAKGGATSWAITVNPAGQISVAKAVTTP